MGAEAVRDPQTFHIIGAAMEVHRCLGCGFPEAPYSEALEQEFGVRGIPFDKEVRFDINYKGKPLRNYYRADFVCYDQIVVELKALQHITRIEQSQAITYLKASGLTRALILNFGSSSLQYQRVVRSFISSA